MARVPVYGTDLIDPTPLPGVRQSTVASADMFNTGKGDEALGRGLMQFGGKLADIATDQQMVINSEAITRAEVAHKDMESQFRQELGQRQGINAAHAAADASKWWDDTQRKHLESLENDAQRRAFARVMAERRGTFMDFAYKHQNTEMDRAWADSKNASIASSINLAASAAGDDGVLAQERARIDGNLLDISRRLGWSPEVAAQKRGEALTQLHKQSIDNLVVNYPRRAQDYLDKHGAEIAADKRDELVKVVRKANIEMDGRELSQQTISAGYNQGIKMLNAEAEKVKAIANPGEREARLDMIDKARLFHTQEFARRDQQRERNQRDAGEAAWSFVRNNPGQLPPINVRDAMDPRAAYALEKHIAGGEGKVNTNWAAYATLRKEARENPERFAQRDLYKYFDVLGKSQREGLLDLQDKIAGAKPEKIKHLESLDSFIERYGVDNKIVKKKDSEKFFNFENTVKDELRSVAKGKDVPEDRLTSDDWQKAADRAVMNIEVPGRLWGTREIPRYEARDMMARTLQDIPEKDRQRIRARYKERTGAMLPDKKLIDLFNAEKGIK